MSGFHYQNPELNEQLQPKQENLWPACFPLDPFNENFMPFVGQPIGKQQRLSIKQSWSRQEDSMLFALAFESDKRRWKSIAQKLNDTFHKGKSVRNRRHCSNRWINHLDPKLHNNKWQEFEDQELIRLEKMFGHKWSNIASCLPGRSAQAVKNRWVSLQSCTRKNEKEEDSRNDPRVIKMAPTPETQVSNEFPIWPEMPPVEMLPPVWFNMINSANTGMPTFNFQFY